MTTLDDLLGYEDAGPEPEPPARSRSDAPWWWLLKTVLAVAALAAPLWWFVRLLGGDVPYPLLVMVGVVGRLMWVLTVLIAPRPLPLTLTRPSTELVSEDQIIRATAGTQDPLYLATARWDVRLSWVRRDKGHFAREVQPKLIELIDERLWLRHGLHREADPVRARALLGEQLWTLVNQPITRGMSPAEVAGLIAVMEAL